MILRVILLILVASMGAAPAHALTGEARRALPAAERVGAARFSVLSMPIFDAALYAEQAFSWSRPFAVELTYRRAISAQALVDRSVTEIARRTSQSPAALSPLRANLRACFADVRPGDQVTGVSTGENSALFTLNGAVRCRVEWPGFRRAFFGIWLDGQSGQREFSRRLRGENNGSSTPS